MAIWLRNTGQEYPKKKTVKLDPEIEKLIVKYLSNAASASEMEDLAQWLEDPNNEQLFREFVKTNYAIDYNLRAFDTKQAKERLLKKIRQDRTPFYPRWVRATIKYAAAVILLLGLAYLYRNDLFNIQPEQLVINDESITLELEDGSIQIIEENDSLVITDAAGKVVGKQNGNQIQYSDVAVSDAQAYNKISVPYGKRFAIQLSDGTVVHLNAGTKLRYPVYFLNGLQRKVSLNGEAYFDVTTDAEHPFVVNTTELSVAVLGTQFNVSSYPEDRLTDVVLVEGMVAMYTDSGIKKDSTVLTPGVRGSFDKEKKTVTTEMVKASVYTSWRNGELVFRNSPFRNIMKKLERHYNITIVLNNDALGEELFSASFTNKSIEEVLSYFDFIKGIDYTLKDNTVYIN